ncbi:MAG: MFS transporter [Sandaracinaceae bacterium]|nr:MFS transporter [Sandaracinaceae bacterium]
MSDEPQKAAEPAVVFPRSFYVANGIELFERWAFYGLYVVLSLHLTSVVGLSDAQAGDVMALYAFFRLGPLIGGIIADRIGFKQALAVSLGIYAVGYAVLGFAHDASMASLSIVLIGLAGALFKPIITGTVVRTSPPGKQTEGFAIFYRTVNAGSVIGKSLTYGIRTLGALSLVVFNAVAASVIGLCLALFVFVEPGAKTPDTKTPDTKTPDTKTPDTKAADAKAADTKAAGAEPAKPSVLTVLKGVWTALRDVRFSGALLILTGFYFMSEQFYQTFPKYITRSVSEHAPLEWVTMLNPLTIALFQGLVTKKTKGLSPLVAMVLASFVGALSMFLMGTLGPVLGARVGPSLGEHGGVALGLGGACVSFAVFAFAEMIFAPRFYDYVARFAPKGQEATFMGLTVLPVALGGMIGGVVSGRLIDRYLPLEGDRDPFTIWSIYAGLGVVSAIVMLAYERMVRRPEPTTGSSST